MCFNVRYLSSQKKLRLAVHRVKSGNVKDAQNKTLSHDVNKRNVIRNNGCIAVLRESIGAVVHDAGHIVQFAKVADAIGVVFVEVVFGARLQVLEGDAHKIVTFGGALHVIESKRVQELVHDGANSEAALLDGVQLQIDALATVVEVTDVRVASAEVGLLTSAIDWTLFSTIKRISVYTYRHLDVGHFGGTVDESQTAHRLHGAQSFENVRFMFGAKVSLGQHHWNGVVGPTVVQGNKASAIDHLVHNTLNHHHLLGGEHHITLELTAQLLDVLLEITSSNGGD